MWRTILFWVLLSLVPELRATGNDILGLKIPEDPVLNANTVCRTFPGLSKKQLQLCYEYPDVTAAAIQGVQIAIHECQWQFKNHRWNCSNLETKNKNPHLTQIARKGIRETAFTFASVSAGVAHAVANACSLGKLHTCGCDNDYPTKPQIPTYSPSSFPGAIPGGPIPGYPPGYTQGQTAVLHTNSGGGKSYNDWSWGGCSHNIEYGIKFSKDFLDSRETSVDIFSRMRLHNNRAGRLAVSTNMQRRCKCHGMSGSCNLKTCWKATPDFREVGVILKERFDYATQIKVSNDNYGRLETIYANRPPFATDLVYFDRSPDFCDRNRELETPGTRGRICNKTSSGPDSCAALCCGRGFNIFRQTRVERCNCKFHWCCYVICEECRITEWVNSCK
ncbi:PREDICTED: protein Wnt-10a-like [Branchiostoma belcheri]|uniref:Protein Wnt n=1 Tax=Branchiostoma belcheri TaxID=7741 RepID=A0A6P4YGU8_BRABE|nr:PREDICTED: protein Wnt-10a-like [Branchiostoma belcheri]